MTDRRRSLAAGCGVLVVCSLVSATAYADVVWPALFLEERFWRWWIIGGGLLVEWPAVRWLTRRTWLQSAGLDVLMNLASALLGILLVPLAGVLWELIRGLILYQLLNLGSFHITGWIGTVLFATAANAGIEGVVLRAFGTPMSWRRFAVLCLANLVSVGLAVLSLALAPPRDWTSGSILSGLP